VVAVSVLAAACGGDRERVEMIAGFDKVVKRPEASVFSVGDVTLNNETKHAISVQPVPGSRLIWKVRIPEDGRLNVNVGLKPEAWNQEGDGVLFQVGISDGRNYDELFTQHLNPYSAPADRRWVPIWVDVANYGGEEVDVIFNTVASRPNQPGDTRNDYALWGEPVIVAR
jgi:hypothetical protein